ncbi:MAG TPA: hypothetical protein VMD02_02160 [Candidatus Omnitrophota bacterium]|nr:hypothetical protein [Candidatus Omnitrophota bacterium]
MIQSLNNFPARQSVPLARLTADPASAHRQIMSLGQRLGFTGEIKWERTNLASGADLVATAACGPCLFIAKVESDAVGQFERSLIGHWSVNFTPRMVNDFLGYDRSAAKRTKLFLAGMSQRSSHDSLRDSVLELFGRINDYGVPLSLVWDAPDRPVLTDLRDGRIISDLGLGLNSEPGFVSRQISFIGNPLNSLVISSLYDELRHLRTTVFAVGAGPSVISSGSSQSNN